MAEQHQGASSPAAHAWQRGQYLVSTDPRRLDLEVVHGFLTTSYWAAGIRLELVQRSIEHSLPFGLYAGERQVGFARVITDFTTFAYVADVFILGAYRGQGLGRWLMECVVAHPHLQALRRWTLFTRDAHGLYEQVGFTRASAPERLMERTFPTIYQEGAI